jgi:hypothetical protein
MGRYTEQATEGSDAIRRGVAILLQLRQEEEFARLRTGHARLTHGRLLQDDPKHLCTHCGLRLTDLTTRLECPQYDAERRTFHLQGTLRDILRDDRDNV